MNYSKNNITKIEQELKNPDIKLVAMLAPSFASEFKYPTIINQLKKLGVDKCVELTFGAKLVNREYHKILSAPENKGKLFIASVCPGVVEFVKQKYPQYKKNLMPVDSPMIATAKVCKKVYPKHKTLFIAPCAFKKLEAENSKEVDYTLDYQQLHELFNKNNIKPGKEKPCDVMFDKFYNDYTKIYPLSGGLSKTAHVKGILPQHYSIVLDGVVPLDKFLKQHSNEIRFVDACFCIGACIGGPCLSKNTSLAERKKRVLNYLEVAKHECMPAGRKGIIGKAKGLNFEKRY